MVRPQCLFETHCLCVHPDLSADRMVRHRRTSWVLPVPAARNCVRAGSKKPSVKNSSPTTTDLRCLCLFQYKLGVDRQTEMLQTLVLFLQQLFTQTSGSVFPKVLGHLVHTTATGVSFPSATGSYSCSGFLLSIPKPRECISMYILHLISLGIIYSKGRFWRYETGKWKLEGRVNWDYEHTAAEKKKNQLYSFRDGKNKQKNQYTLPLCCTYSD